MNPLAIATQMIETSASACTLNGQEVPCDQLVEEAGSFLWIGGLAMMVMIGLSIATLVFWVMMLVHACTHENKDKTLWILIIVFTGFIGALIYYFVVKRETHNR